jgi:hypothetical protein
MRHRNTKQKGKKTNGQHKSSTANKISSLMRRKLFILRRIYILLCNDLVNTFQKTHNNSSCILCGQCYSSLLDNKNLTIKEEFSMWSAPCQALGNGPMNTHSDTWRIISMGYDPRLYNENLFVMPRVEYLHRDPASRRRRRKSETVKYGHESHWTRTRERLRWRGSAAYTLDRLVLLSERAPHKTRP